MRLPPLSLTHVDLQRAGDQIGADRLRVVCHIIIICNTEIGHTQTLVPVLHLIEEVQPLGYSALRRDSRSADINRS